MNDPRFDDDRLGGGPEDPAPEDQPSEGEEHEVDKDLEKEDIPI